MAVKSLWLVQVAILLPVIIALMVNYRNTPLHWHVRLVGSAYLVLVLIDVYTVWFEGYPCLSPKGFAMLIAFVLGNMTLIKMAIASNRNWRKFGDCHGASSDASSSDAIR